MSDEGRLVAGRYRLVERIGSGAMGVVWRAIDERLSRSVAVKKLLLPPGLPPEEADEAVARCLREGRIAARLHHPNAIAVFDVVDEDGVPCLIMEYLPSVSLAIALSDDGPMDPVEVARIGSQVAAALAAAHAAGIVHRDIKPGNILLGDDGSVKITDFGISRATDDVTVTKTGLIAGTPAYLAPEVAIGREPSAASDVFSLGSTLYAAAEGEPPFGLSENTLGLLHAVASGKLNEPKQSGALTGVLMALLATDVEDRPSAGRARDLLATVARGEEPNLPKIAAAEPDVATRLVVATGPTGEREQPEPRAKSAKPLVFASAAVTVALALGAWMVVNKGGAAEKINDGPTRLNNVPTSTVTVTSVEEPELTSVKPPVKVNPTPTSTSEKNSSTVTPTTTTTTAPSTPTSTSDTVTTTPSVSPSPTTSATEPTAVTTTR
ncbi:serine/threonine-protein kinase [Actinokineospora xionganensis]|uniref:non-specific serine/threonine protein kinase n=1 Tax=Actinokineospora xionganensis TaxID=2684470 RepID=A0ABR7L0P5_9PSEU|nr:serine/threonine-protein kinase [Actinokineospora xionganensis]MBC6446261.1 serine/threonine protein kinase [Actinokineospora xionganensis]